MENFKKYLSDNANIKDEKFDFLKDYITIKKVKKGTFLLRPGEVCSHNFFVDQGLLRSYTINEETAKEHIIQFASETWIIGDRNSIYFNEPSELFIEAIEDSSLILLDDVYIQKACNLSSTFADFNDKSLHNFIRHLQKRVNLLLGATAEERYLDFIKMYYDLTLRVPQWMIASYLGITPESLSRVRKELASKNFKK